MRGELLATRGRVIAIAAVLAFAIVSPLFVDEFSVLVLNQCLIWGILALSLDLMLGHTGMASLGHAAYFGTGAYATAIMSATYGASFGEAFVVAIIAAAVVTAICALVALRASDVYFLMITFALAMLIWGLAYRWDSMTGGENGIAGIDRPLFMEDTITYYYFTLIVAAGVFLFFSVLVHSCFGKTMVGIRESESRMRALGYNVWLHKFIIYMISGLFSGLAGFLWVYYNSYVAPTDVELVTSFNALLMVSLGGPGTLAGPLLGSTIFVILDNSVNMFTERSLTVVGCIYIVVVLFAPEGIMGFIKQLRTKVGETDNG